MSDQEHILTSQINEAGAFFVINGQQREVADYSPVKSGLEWAFDINNAHFNRYLELGAYNLSLDEALETCSAMSESDHPYIAYAAGSIMAELALSQTHALTLDDRLTAISIAQEAWGKAGRLEEANNTVYGELESSDEKRQFQFHLTHDLCYIPSLELAARLVACDEKVGFNDLAAALEATHYNTNSLAEILLSYPKSEQINGFIGEVVAAKLIQRKATDKLVLPAPLRLDHNIDKDYRADLISVPLHRTDMPTLLQVKGFGEEVDRESTTRLFISAKQLVLFDQGHPRQTLCYLLEEDRLDLSYVTNGLDRLSDRLNNKIDAFEAS